MFQSDLHDQIAMTERRIAYREREIRNACRRGKRDRHAEDHLAALRGHLEALREDYYTLT